MKINSTIRSFTAQYDFSVYGGEIGTINLGSFLKPNSIISNYYIYTKISAQSDGIAVIDFGLTGLYPDTFYDSTFDFYIVGSFYPNSENLCIIPSSGSEITMTIFDAPLTAGSIMIGLSCYEF